jgi:tight adherence protein B
VTEVDLIVGLAVLCLMMAGILLWRTGKGKQRQNIRRIEEILAGDQAPDGLAAATGERDWLPPVVESLFQRAGLTPDTRLYLLLAAPALVLAVLGELLAGPKGLLAGLLLAYPAWLITFLRWRIDLFHDRVVVQLPNFIDSVARILSIGSSLELAFRNASEECDEPLRGITGQMLLRVRAGLALEDAMNQVADTYRIRDLSYMASVFYLGVRYGGNARAVLERIALAMRERERSQQELHAMTSETRASAWILSALPVLVGVLILSSNPKYLHGMWLDPLGHKLLLSAVALQVIGMWLLFRMAKLRYH